jgi:hypothetical protein
LAASKPVVIARKIVEIGRAFCYDSVHMYINQRQGTPMQSPIHKSRKAGRPRALDHVKQREIIAVVTAGFSIERAARYVDCAASTIRRECRRNPQFCGELRRAALSAELSPLQAIRESARKYWRAGAWLLERLDPERFGKRVPGHIKPEQLEAFTEVLLDIVGKEVASPEERQRLYDRIAELNTYAERQGEILRDTPPRRRSKRRASNQLSPAAQQIFDEINQAVDGDTIAGPLDEEQVERQSA